MISGRYTRKVVIQKTTQTIDDFGGVTESWADLKTIWANKETIGGREYFESHQTNADLTIKFRFRYQSGITPKMRVLDNAQIFDIHSVIDVNDRHREIEIYCTERL